MRYASSSNVIFGSPPSTTTSTPRPASVNAASAAAFAVSVTTNVPDTTPTPSRIAKAVNTSRVLCARTLRRV
jgi:hypothetical protein